MALQLCNELFGAAKVGFISNPRGIRAMVFRSPNALKRDVSDFTSLHTGLYHVEVSTHQERRLLRFKSTITPQQCIPKLIQPMLRHARKVIFNFERNLMLHNLLYRCALIGKNA